MILARVLIAVSLLVAMTPASAQPVNDRADALFKQGRELMTAGKPAEACAAFEQSQQLDPKVTTLLNLAGCREKLDQLATARELFLEAERQTRTKGDAATTQLHKVAVERAFKLEPRVSKLTILVPDDRKLTGLEISRDGRTVPAELWNREQPVDGGTYMIAARAPGVEPWSTRVTIAPEGDARTVTVPGHRNSPEGLPAPVDTKPNSRPQAAGEPPRPGLGIPITVGASAAVLLGGALGFSRWASSTYGDANAELVDQARRDSLESSANHKRYAAEGMAIAGVACVAVAVWLYARQRGEPSRPTVARTVRLHALPTAQGFGVVGQF